MLQDLREQQDVIASVSHTPEDLPADQLFFTEAFPLGERITESLDAIISLERSEEATEDRKLLVERVAAAEVHVLKTEASVIAYLASGTPEDFGLFTKNAEACSASVDRLKGMTDLLTEEQRGHLDAYLTDRVAFLAATLEAVEIRGGAGWCVSEDVCLNAGTPLAGGASALAETIAGNAETTKGACEASAGSIASLSEKANGLRALTDEFRV